jgi:hypothetical protein
MRLGASARLLLVNEMFAGSLPGSGMGDDKEAVLYASENREVWRSTPGALEWLSVKVK